MKHNSTKYFVNSVEYETDEKELTPREILTRAGYSPDEYKLVRANNPNHELPSDKPEHIHEAEQFLALRNTNPVSDSFGIDDIQRYFETVLGLHTEYLDGKNGRNFVIVGVTIPGGVLSGKVCDVAIQHNSSVPFLPQSAFHTRPHLVPMDTAHPRRATQAGKIGPEWQYWSRKWDKPPRTGADIWAWILTALAQAE